MLRVLVVDDDDIVRAGVSEALEDAGHTVHQATDGLKAMALITERVFDVAVCDVQMPGLDGLGLFRQIRRRAPNTSVIFMTGFARVEDAVGTLRDGAADYVSKPFDPAEFARNVIGPIAERHALRKHLEEALGVRIAFLAGNESSVLITGERGTELVARTIHSQSPRRAGPLVVVSCESLAETIFESEDKALSQSRPLLERDAWFRAAEGGTLILKDIDMLSLGAQAAVIRAMDEPSLRARRDQNWRPAGVRVLSTTHENMPRRTAAGLFLDSLLYRLSGKSVPVPSVREREAIEVAHVPEKIALS